MVQRGANSGYTQYYLNQAGGSGAPLVHGTFGRLHVQQPILQRGYGVGGLFAAAATHLTPLLLKGLRAVKDSLLTAGSNVVRDLGRRPLDEILKEQGRGLATDLTDKAGKQVRQWVGAGAGRRKTIKRLVGSGVGISPMARRARASVNGLATISSLNPPSSIRRRRKRTTTAKRKSLTVKQQIGGRRKRRRRRRIGGGGAIVKRAGRRRRRRRTIASSSSKRALDIFT